MEKLDPDCLTALPDNLEDAHKEIRYLQKTLYNERLTWWRKLEKALRDHKSAVGELKKLKKDYEDPEPLPSRVKGAWEY